MLEIIHKYEWTELESKWYNEVLLLLYGPYLRIHSFKIEDKYQKIKLRNVSMEELLKLEWNDDDILLSSKGKLLALHGRIKIKLLYEPMQQRLLPEIIIRYQNIALNPSQPIQELLNLSLEEKPVQFHIDNFQIFNEF